MTWLLILLVVVAVSRPGTSWRAGCCTFVGFTLAFDLACSRLPGEWYFLAAAATASVCVILLERVEYCYPLQVVCLVAIVLNFIGWGRYEAGDPATLYVLAFQFLYAYAILIFIFGGPTRADSTDTRHFSSILRPTY